MPAIDRRRMGQMVFRHPNDVDNSTAILLQLTDRGIIHRMDIGLQEAARPVGRTHEWAQEILDLEKATETSTADIGTFDGMTHTEVDLESVYQR